MFSDRLMHAFERAFAGMQNGAQGIEMPHWHDLSVYEGPLEHAGCEERVSRSRSAVFVLQADLIRVVAKLIGLRNWRLSTSALDRFAMRKTFGRRFIARHD